MSNTEIKNLPEEPAGDDELNADQLRDISGGLANSTVPSFDTLSVGGTANNAKAGRTQIVFTGDEVDSQ